MQLLRAYEWHEIISRTPRRSLIPKLWSQYEKLKAITGKGPAEFIRTIRLKLVRQLLEKSQLQIAEIACEVGDNSPIRFAINFREKFGMSPLESLRIHKLQE